MFCLFSFVPKIDSWYSDWRYLEIYIHISVLTLTDILPAFFKKEFIRRFVIIIKNKKQQLFVTTQLYVGAFYMFLLSLRVSFIVHPLFIPSWSSCKQPLRKFVNFLTKKICNQLLTFNLKYCPPVWVFSIESSLRSCLYEDWGGLTIGWRLQSFLNKFAVKFKLSHNAFHPVSARHDTGIAETMFSK